MSNVEWRFSDNKVDKDILRKFESQNKFEFPQAYVDLVLKSNGATPSKKKFYTQDKTEHIFNYLLDWSDKQKGNILSTYHSFSEEHEKSIVPFANDPFGNLICFNFLSKAKAPSVVYWDHELDIFHMVRDSFNDFINTLK